MNIIFSNYDDINNPYYGGGGAVAIHEVAKRLAKKHTVTILTGKYPGSTTVTKDGVQYIRIGTPYGGPLFGQLIYQLSLPFHVITRSFDVWVESFTPPYSTAFLPLFTKKPVIGLVHLLGGKDKSRQYRLPFYLIENLGLRFYKYFSVLTKDTEKRIRTINKSAHITIIPNGITMTSVKQPAAAKNHIFFIGRIEIDQKGLDLLIRAYKKIASNVPYKLVIAGAGTRKDVRQLKMLIAKHNLSKSIEMVGKVTGLQKHNLYKNALFVVLPSRYETFGLVALEAFAYKLPLIAFDIPGLRWIPQTCAVKVKKFDIEKLAKHMIDIITNMKKQKQIGNYAYTFVQKYSWESIAPKYERMIKSVHSKHTK